MLTILVSLSVAAAGAAAMLAAGLGLGWAMPLSFALFLACQIAIGLILRKRIMATHMRIQAIVQDGQQEMMRKLNQQAFRQRDPRALAPIIQKDQERVVRAALEATSLLEPYVKWNFLMRKQINTLRMQFHYQLGEYDAVDSLLPRCMLADPMSIAMRLARHHAKGESAAADALFEKKINGFKGASGTILYALYSWMLLKRGEGDKAQKILARAKDLTGDETLARNWEALANGKPGKFSNAGLGDSWYALRLEEPKVKVKQKFAHPF